MGKNHKKEIFASACRTYRAIAKRLKIVLQKPNGTTKHIHKIGKIWIVFGCPTKISRLFD